MKHYWTSGQVELHSKCRVSALMAVDEVLLVGLTREKPMPFPHSVVELEYTYPDFSDPAQ